MMFAPISEDYHESTAKRKPRSLSSQEVILNSIPRSLPQSPILSLTPTSSIASSLRSSLTVNVNAIPASNNGSMFSSLEEDSSLLDSGGYIGIDHDLSRSPVPVSPGNGQSDTNKFTTTVTTTTTTSKPAPPRAGSISSSLSIPNELNITIEKATLKDYHRVAKTLMFGFEDDPFMNYILNTDKYNKHTTPATVYKRKKLDLFLSYFEYETYEVLNTNGTIFVIKDKQLEQTLAELDVNTDKFPYLAVALWNPLNLYESDESGDSDEDETFSAADLKFKDKIHKSSLKFNYRAILSKCRSKVFKDKLPYLIKVRNEILNANLDDLDSQIWYLDDIATLPSMRGKGLAKLLYNYSLDKFISENPNSVMYLESSNPVNRNFYLKLGFRLCRSYSVKYNRYVDSDKVVKDIKNEGVNMDAMIYCPSTG
ncbi:uncharacterized protein SPAPADRAFT_59386 [Spathaspora passalidarum NRRL Y-27907]|uniref:N-acetyltransferase domain-containing protein n=1 Tax=Spathaspora passalidarum (strain NRRL Y-27907 / 11-Y1) TaxID=619300 RepID=G3AJS9_SPAPN|nr:uncharacterized protein SPAPADRAFT_59386 [Spathaspora passalidarum NRRL Y-27907]EGW33980.1 hypothetical protein SPAPADRAFT_59386 [Spathaspora passalidarum NRRL Y-27907]